MNSALDKLHFGVSFLHHKPIIHRRTHGGMLSNSSNTMVETEEETPFVSSSSYGKYLVNQRGERVNDNIEDDEDEEEEEEETPKIKISPREIIYIINQLTGYTLSEVEIRSHLDEDSMLNTLYSLYEYALDRQNDIGKRIHKNRFMIVYNRFKEYYKQQKKYTQKNEKQEKKIQNIRKSSVISKALTHSPHSSYRKKEKAFNILKQRTAEEHRREQDIELFRTIWLYTEEGSLMDGKTFENGLIRAINSSPFFGDFRRRFIINDSNPITTNDAENMKNKTSAQQKTIYSRYDLGDGYKSLNQIIDRLNGGDIFGSSRELIPYIHNGRTRMNTIRRLDIDQVQYIIIDTYSRYNIFEIKYFNTRGKTYTYEGLLSGRETLDIQYTKIFGSIPSDAINQTQIPLYRFVNGEIKIQTLFHGGAISTLENPYDYSSDNLFQYQILYYTNPQYDNTPKDYHLLAYIEDGLYMMKMNNIDVFDYSPLCMTNSITYINKIDEGEITNEIIDVENNFCSDRIRELFTENNIDIHNDNRPIISQLMINIFSLLSDVLFNVIIEKINKMINEQNDKELYKLMTTIIPLYENFLINTGPVELTYNKKKYENIFGFFIKKDNKPYIRFNRVVVYNTERIHVYKAKILKVILNDIEHPSVKETEMLMKPHNIQLNNYNTMKQQYGFDTDDIYIAVRKENDYYTAETKISYGGKEMFSIVFTKKMIQEFFKYWIEYMK
jgi:hypothetical protein